MAAILDFQLKRFYLRIFDLVQVTQLPSFKSICLSAKEKFKISFQDGGRGSHLGFSIGTILAIFDQQLSYPDTNSYQVPSQLIGLSVQKKFEIFFQDGGRGSHLWISNRNNLSYFWSTIKLPRNLFLPSSESINWPFGSGEVQNIFSRWRPWQPSLDFQSEQFKLFLINN